ncbi:MAG: PepSY domain-containing protein [Rhodocyclaceae bacterium]|nr:PepSY domain-containing protein [Rhodocyclaceae bacterium]
MRRIWLVLHRGVGLAIALFLFLAGSTGALISWDKELDEWLNPQLHQAHGQGQALDPFDLAQKIEAADPRAWVIRVPLFREEGKSAKFLVTPRIDPATGAPYELDYNEIYLDPVSGEEVGRREWGKFSLDRTHLLSFLYKFHYTLHIPDFWGINRWGEWLMGGIALLWLSDCLVGFALTLPRRWRGTTNPAGEEASGATNPRHHRSWWRRWRRSWGVRWRRGRFQRMFDLHRAAGLWTWLLLATLALSAATLNLFPEVFRPILLAVSDFSPRPIDVYPEAPERQPIMPGLAYREVVARAAEEARKLGWKEPVNRVFYSHRRGYYSVSFFHPADYLAVDGMPHKRLFFDAFDGRLISIRAPWAGSGADVFVQAQFPVHSGRILGLPGRILISAMGLVVAVLSVTGVYIWLRKRKGKAAGHQT